MPRHYKLPENPDHYELGHGADASNTCLFFFGFIPELPEVDSELVAKELMEKVRQIRVKQAEVEALEADLPGVCARVAKYINAHWKPAELQKARDAFLADFHADRKAKDDAEADAAIVAVLDAHRPLNKEELTAAVKADAKKRKRAANKRVGRSFGKPTARRGSDV